MTLRQRDVKLLSASIADPIDTRLLDINLYCPQLFHAHGPKKVG